ncbi:MAG: hypothetical protein EXX96DRAFT_71330 [Benjaminiella poitrasii]|nr:MAG: hypothetical protein EXX96DRAFT_71330 [Benjaminiella poitrasii]
MKYLFFIFTVTYLLSCIIAFPLSESIPSAVLQDDNTVKISTSEETKVLQTENNDNEQKDSLTEKQEEEEEDVFPVQVDGLAQIIATHLQFDHLDAVISNTDKEIATEFQHHIQINVQPNFDDYLMTNDEEPGFLANGANQYTIQQQLPTLDMMDLEILKSQIFAAIQAHTEGNLPLTWDKFADKLSRQAIEKYLQKSLIETCGKPSEDVILSSCLQENAVQLAIDLDKYITHSLAYVFEVLDRETLPSLLQHTADDLEGILRYFNSVFLQDGNRKFVLQVVPWNSDQDDVHSFKSRLLDLAVHPISDGTEEIHSTAFFVEYADMARV